MSFRSRGRKTGRVIYVAGDKYGLRVNKLTVKLTVDTRDTECTGYFTDLTFQEGKRITKYFQNIDDQVIQDYDTPSFYNAIVRGDTMISIPLGSEVAVDGTTMPSEVGRVNSMTKITLTSCTDFNPNTDEILITKRKSNFGFNVIEPFATDKEMIFDGFTSIDYKNGAAGVYKNGPYISMGDGFNQIRIKTSTSRKLNAFFEVGNSYRKEVE